MAFLSGSVSFTRYRVIGGSPRRLDEHLLEKFRAHVIGKQRTRRSDGEEIGWIGGRHILDREFDIEKNVILDCLHFGLRIDSARIPPDLIRAYVQQEYDSLRRTRTKAEDGRNGEGRTVARLRRQAVDAAKRRADEEIKQGRYHTMRQVPLLWDTRNDVLYVGSTAPAAFERLYPLFRESFDRRLEPMTAGSIAYRLAEEAGLSRKLESLQPARLVRHPEGNGHIDVHWTASDPASRDYLGNEFLLWLWYTLAEGSDTITLADKSEVAVAIIKQVALDCPWAEFGRDVFTADGPTRLPESRLALQTGKLPRKAGLIISRQDEQYEFAFQAETFAVASAVLPRIETDEGGRARIEERLEQIRELAGTIDLLYQAFLVQRLSPEWSDTAAAMTGWLRPAMAAPMLVSA